ncbi:MAG TPA: hypothetical protein VED59_08965, partial [Acidimicrobiales bacterium]|nr:hypothetical protein [Acidimicrobiales bacterium]
EPSWALTRQFFRLAGFFAKRISRGLVILIDDADRLGGGQLEALGCLARALSRDDLPVALVVSGGPELAARCARVGNLSGTVWPVTLGWFDEEEAREALVVPAAERGVEWEEEALEMLCAAAAGSPLELQRLGFAAWSLSAAAMSALRERAPDVQPPEATARRPPEVSRPWPSLVISTAAAREAIRLGEPMPAERLLAASTAS